VNPKFLWKDFEDFWSRRGFGEVRRMLGFWRKGESTGENEERGVRAL